MKILLVSPNKDDSTSFYRSFGVFGSLKHYVKDLQIIAFDGSPLTWSDFAQLDCAVFQRPYSNFHWNSIQYLKEMGVPVWVDYDDNLHEVPDDNPNFISFNSIEIKKNILEIITIADVVTVSTQALKDYFLPANKNIHVVPNAFNDYFFKEKTLPERSEVVAWRGSNTHVMDLMAYGQAIANNINAHQTLKWMFLGYHPFFLNSLAPGRFISRPPIDPFIYHRQLMVLAARIMHVPLVENAFNLCKSNIAQIEATWSGAACLVPNWIEWDIPGAVKYNNEKEYDALLDGMCKGEINLAEKRKISWEYIQDNLILSKVNLKRAEILNSLKVYA
jgi:hypothetical protein